MSLLAITMYNATHKGSACSSAMLKLNNMGAGSDTACCVSSQTWSSLARLACRPPSQASTTCLDLNVAGQGWLAGTPVPDVLSSQYKELSRVGDALGFVHLASKQYLLSAAVDCMKRIPPPFLYLYEASQKFCDATFGRDDDYDATLNKYRRAILTMWVSKAMQPLYREFAQLAFLISRSEASLQSYSDAIVRLRASPSHNLDALMAAMPQQLHSLVGKSFPCLWKPKAPTHETKAETERDKVINDIVKIFDKTRSRSVNDDSSDSEGDGDGGDDRFSGYFPDDSHTV